MGCRARRSCCPLGIVMPGCRARFLLEIGELVSNLRHRARDASRVLPSAPLGRPPNNNNITELLPLDRDIPTFLTHTLRCTSTSSTLKKFFADTFFQQKPSPSVISLQNIPGYLRLTLMLLSYLTRFEDSKVHSRRR